MTRDHAQYDMLQKLSTVVQVQRDGKEIWRGRVLKHEADFTTGGWCTARAR